MSYPYPQDRHRDRKEKGEQPYKDAREAMSQKDAELRAESIPDERDEFVSHETELEERLRRVNTDIEEERRPG